MQLWKGSCRTTVDAGALLTAAVTNESGELQKSRMKRQDSALSSGIHRMAEAVQAAKGQKESTMMWAGYRTS